MFAFIAYKNIKLFQIDVKSSFLNEFIEEEVVLNASSMLSPLLKVKLTVKMLG